MEDGGRRGPLEVCHGFGDRPYRANAAVARRYCTIPGHPRGCRGGAGTAGRRESPSQTISDLEDQGYDVQINYVMGNSNTPLDMCRVLAVHNPNRSGKPVDSFTTVYVDISCPDFWQDD
ncbi:hypothetical protein I540_1775 [Mycobacteroides abscessus subsp. bolletii 1513]|uniref:Uncharacterized protein n=1 Tax=Mycobacteroides abscessus subsp. bolletii 1513 TaxID=1299321 RepID=X8DXD8_9MYCO|nr:hypothetical protein I540_1775 [Mycobacteroides abscessus subsp. bolletii 1513]